MFVDYSEGNDDVSGGESEIEENESDLKNHSIIENSPLNPETSSVSNEICADHGCEHECYMMKYDEETHMMKEQW
jgi:hypothetical protein